MESLTYHRIIPFGSQQAAVLVDVSKYCGGGIHELPSMTESAFPWRSCDVNFCPLDGAVIHFVVVDRRGYRQNDALHRRRSRQRRVVSPLSPAFRATAVSVVRCAPHDAKAVLPVADDRLEHRPESDVDCPDVELVERSPAHLRITDESAARADGTGVDDGTFWTPTIAVRSDNHRWMASIGQFDLRCIYPDVRSIGFR